MKHWTEEQEENHTDGQNEGEVKAERYIPEGERNGYDKTVCRGCGGRLWGKARPPSAYISDCKCNKNKTELKTIIEV